MRRAPSVAQAEPSFNPSSQTPTRVPETLGQALRATRPAAKPGLVSMGSAPLTAASDRLRRALCHLNTARSIPRGSKKRRGRNGARDAAAILLAYRHGLRAAELSSLKWSQIDLRHGRLHVNRAKGGIESVHPLHGPELRALRPIHASKLGIACGTTIPGAAQRASIQNHSGVTQGLAGRPAAG
jgi:integrase